MLSQQDWILIVRCSEMGAILGEFDADLQRVDDYWSSYEPELSTSFFGFPPLRPYLIETAFDAELAAEHADNPWWAEDIFTDLYLRDQNIKSVLSICCGFGATEQHLLQRLGGIESCVAVDVAEGALAEAARRAESLGLGARICYHVADLNNYDWPLEQFDLVIAGGALHHLSGLETVLTGIKRCLRPGGFLYANEHTGAQWQDFPPRQVELINSVAYLVPPDMRSRSPLRRNPFSQPVLRRIADALLGNSAIPLPADRPFWYRLAGRVVNAMSMRPPAFGPLVLSKKAYLLGHDPSEGVSSDRILPAIQECFEDARIHPYGGAILAYAFDGAFFKGYDDLNAQHRVVLETACGIERSMVESGDLPVEHAIIVARKDARPDASNKRINTTRTA